MARHKEFPMFTFTENTKGFGKDLGVMHQMVMLSRRHNVGQKFWGFLAHNEDLFKRIIVMAEEAVALQPTDVGNLIDTLMAIRAEGCPIREQESYYARSSHSEHRVLVSRQMTSRFAALMKKAEHNPQAEAICVELEKFFQIAYVRSAVYCQIHEEPEHNRWFHEPIWGLHTTFMDLWDGDGRVYLGSFLDHETFTSDKHIEAFVDLWKPISEEWDRAYKAKKDQCLRLTEEQLNNLLKGLDQCLDGILGNIRDMICRPT